MQGLNQINQSRSQAASEKANARANLLSQTQAAISNLTMQQQQFQQSLDQWAAQKSSALTPIAQDPNYVTKLASAYSTFSQNFNPTQFQTSMNVNASGNPTFQVGSINPKKQQDPNAIPENPNNPGFDFFGNKIQ